MQRTELGIGNGVSVYVKSSKNRGRDDLPASLRPSNGLVSRCVKISLLVVISD